MADTIVIGLVVFIIIYLVAQLSSFVLTVGVLVWDALTGFRMWKGYTPDMPEPDYSQFVAAKRGR